MSDVVKLKVAGPRKPRVWPWAIVVVLGLLAVLVGSSAYTIHETEQVVILQFQRPIGEPIDSPGLHFKLPFVQEARRFDKRIKPWDGHPTQIPTRELQSISVDTTARWRITDPLTFYTAVRDERGAISRLNDVLDSTVHDQVTQTRLVDIVRSRDWQVGEDVLETLDSLDEEEQAALTAEVRVGREELTRSILEEARDAVAGFGIELVDVQIKRVNYIAEVRETIYDRMIRERQRVAEEHRSEGHGQAAEILGETRRELARIRSEAERDAQRIRGEADAEATRIYAEAFNSDPEFYAFYRTLESYHRTVNGKATLLVGTDSDYYRYLRQAR